MTEVNVMDWGAIGDGIADDAPAIQAAADTAFGPASNPNGRTNRHRNKPLYFPAGKYRIRDAIKLTKLSGGYVFGDARFATSIIQTTPGRGVFETNGCEYSRFERMYLEAPAVASGDESQSGYSVFDLDWDNSAGSALQSNTFSDIRFQGGHYGLCIGRGGFMGSETLISNCFFSTAAWAGLGTLNYNALQQTVIGGNFASCRVGCYVDKGSIPAIIGVGFQLQTLFDIVVNNSVGDGYSIQGCRTESPNFAQFSNGPHVNITGLRQTSPTSGIAIQTDGQATLMDVRSVNGVVKAINAAQLGIRECQFDRPDFLFFAAPKIAGMPLNLPFPLTTCVEMENVAYGVQLNPETGRSLWKEVRRRRITSNPTGANNLLAYDYAITPASATPIPITVNTGPGE